MELSTYSTITSQQVRLLAETLAQGEIPVIDRFDPIADYEELSTFVAENPTPIFSGTRNPVWRLESVAARLIEAFAIASHEPLPRNSWEVLARIIVEHAEYLYTYHNSPRKHNKLGAGAALALAGGVCHLTPQAGAWRLAGFARIAEAVEGVADTSLQSYLIELVDAAFEMAVALNLPILEKAVDAYNTDFKRELRWERLEHLRLTDSGYFDRLNLDWGGLEGVKSELALGNVEGGKLAYEVFMRRRANDSELYRTPDGCDVTVELQSALITFVSAKSRLERVRCLSTQTGLCASTIVNQTVSETSEIGIAALLYPEWRHRGQLLKLALRRCGRIIKTTFFPDGCHTDGSTRAHHDVFTHLYRFYRLAKLSGLQLPPEFDPQMEKILEAFIYLSQPDYYLPALGDCNPFEVRAVKPCSRGIEIFDREDLKYIASEGKGGAPPKETSHAFPYAGYYVMRDRWHPEAHYLLFDAGQFGEAGHPHEDKLSFLLHAYGRPLIIDSGIGDAAEGTVLGEPASESYFRSSLAHNSLIIDGKGQCRKQMGEEEIVPDPDTRWITAPPFDFVEGWYKEGYASDGEDLVLRDVLHKRSVFYIRGEYFILHDLVLGEGEHQLEQIFHLAPVYNDGGDAGKLGCVEALEAGIVRTADPNLSNIVIAPTDAAGLDVKLESGKSLSYELAYVMNRSLPTAMNVVLFPLPPRLEMLPEINLIDVAADADVLGAAFTVAHSEFTDLVLISDDGFAEICTSDVQFRGEYLVLRFDKQGHPQWCGMINGQFLKWRGSVLVDLPQPQESYVKRLIG